MDVTYRDSLALLKKNDISRLRRARILSTRAILVIGILILYVTPAIGGFAVAGQMLIAYGSCTGL